MTVGEISLLVALVLNGVATLIGVWLTHRATSRGIEIIKKQTDGVILQVAALAKASGHMEGTQAAIKVAAETAAVLALGQQQGRDAERESIAAKTVITDRETPLPVADERTGGASERAADALTQIAHQGVEAAAQRLTNIAEEKKP